jgi:hypothetical protein
MSINLHANDVARKGELFSLYPDILAQPSAEGSGTFRLQYQYGLNYYGIRSLTVVSKSHDILLKIPGNRFDPWRVIMLKRMAFLPSFSI